MQRNFIAQTFSIKNHPISFLDDEYKAQYITGLGEFLCTVTNNDERTKFVFDVWCLSILGHVEQDAWHNVDIRHAHDIKQCLGLKRSGFSLFSMRRPFFFDCFYLLEKSLKKKEEQTFDTLQKLSGLFSKRALKRTYDYFSGIDEDDSSIPDALKNHREHSLAFAMKKPRKVLVVATMSAGKSTLINALVGYKIQQVQSMACTNKIHCIFNIDVDDGAVVTIDNHYAFSEDCSLTQPKEVDNVSLHFNSPLQDMSICLIDSPGVNYSIDPNHGKMTYEMIKTNNYDVLLFVADGQNLETTDQQNLLDFIRNNVKRKVFTL